MIQRADLKERDGRDTKDRILDAAELLFSEHGFAETSLRAITNEADVNLAAVNYHFGTKDALLVAVFARRLEPINRERLERLARMRAEGGSPRLEAVLRAFFEPAFRYLRELGEAGTRFMRLAGRAHSDSNERIRTVFHAQFREVIAAYVQAFAAALPGIPREQLAWRLHFCIGGMAHTLAWTHEYGCSAGFYDDAAPTEPDLVLDSLVSFAAAGLRAYDAMEKAP